MGLPFRFEAGEVRSLKDQSRPEDIARCGTDRAADLGYVAGKASALCASILGINSQ